MYGYGCGLGLGLGLGFANAGWGLGLGHAAWGYGLNAGWGYGNYFNIPLIYYLFVYNLLIFCVAYIEFGICQKTLCNYSIYSP